MLSDPNKFEQMDLGYKGPNIAGIKSNPKKGLPGIVFNSRDAELGLSNTSYYHNARCVFMSIDSKIDLKTGKAKRILDADISILDNQELENIILDIENKEF